MALRKQSAKNATSFPSERQQTEGSTQESEAEEDNKEEFSLSLLPPTSGRDKRRRERENKSNCKEMTEEEMMDLALRLSEQEASVSASELQQEEEAMMKAIQESMVGQAQTCLPSQSPSLLTDAEAAVRVCSRRKLSYSNMAKMSTSNQGILQDSGPTETHLNQEAKAAGDENNNQNKTRKRKKGSPLLEMPDLSQTRKLYPQASPCSSESLSVLLDSPESSDSTQVDDCLLRKSPVFPWTGCRATICVPRLSQELLETCKASGFVSCTQDSWISTQKSLCVQPNSPTFPKSPSNLETHPKSSVFLDTDQGDEGEMELSPEHCKSPVFGRSTQLERSPRACKPPIGKNSGFMFSSQESLTSTSRSTSLRPKSPVFPGSPCLSTNLPAAETSTSCKSPVFSETGQGPPEQSHGGSTSPGTQQRRMTHPDFNSMVHSAAELGKVESPAVWDPSQSPRQDSKNDHTQDSRLNQISTSKTGDAEELNKLSKDCNSAEAELTSDMTLLWSEEDDDDVTPVGSPSPVFPEERPVRQAGSGAASLNHLTPADPEATSSNCSRQGTAEGPFTLPSGEPTGGPMVHYYWGVPFCPRGLDPDSYTKVILAQMEVYEKSLKQAQRCLTRKAEWGEPILPQPEKSPSPESLSESPQPHVPQRRGLRLRGKKLCESADTSPAEEEEEEDPKEEEQEKETAAENNEEETNEGGEDEEDTDDCEVCPETQLSDNSMHDLTVAPHYGAQLQPEGPKLPKAQMMILLDDFPAAEHQVQEEMEVDAPVDGEAEGNIPLPVRKQKVQEQRQDPDVQEVKDRPLQRSECPELDPAAAPQSLEADMDCPICQGSFPVTEIEVHAAYCDGDVAVVDKRRPQVNSLQTPLKTRRKRTRRADVTDEDCDSHSNTGRNHEKCYICQKAFALRDYSRHTELCIQQWATKPGAKGSLLSALEQTESRDSDAGPSKLQPGDVIELPDDEDEEHDDASAIRISNSPIRSFTPISEATDCLIDFKKQQRTRKPSKRRR